jgi:hypothetical protein
MIGYSQPVRCLVELLKSELTGDQLKPGLRFRWKKLWAKNTATMPNLPEPKGPRKFHSLCNPAWITDIQIPTWTTRAVCITVTSREARFQPEQGVLKRLKIFTSGDGDGLQPRIVKFSERATHASSSTRLPSFHGMYRPLTISDWRLYFYIYATAGQHAMSDPTNKSCTSLPVRTWLWILVLYTLFFLFEREKESSHKRVSYSLSLKASSYVVI